MLEIIDCIILYRYHQYIKILLVCLCVTDVGMAITNLWVVCKSITCVSAFTEAFTKIVKAAAGLDTLHCRLREGCHCGRCHCTSDGQEHKIIWRAGPERERIFHLRVTACREQGSHCRHERLAWVASRYGGRGLRAPAHSSRKSWERTTIELTTFILWLIISPCALTGSNL